MWVNQKEGKNRWAGKKAAEEKKLDIWVNAEE
jgi:hypothetical protein